MSVSKNCSSPRLAWMAFCLFSMLVLMITAQRHKNLSFDEFPNLHYGERVLTEGPIAVPDGQRPILMVLNALPCHSYNCSPEVYNTSEAARLWIRLPTMLFALLLGLLIYKWALEIYGPWAAMLALGLYCFNPNFIAHGKQVTSDVATSFFVLLSVYRFRKLVRKNSPRNFLFSVFATTAAILAKYSSVILIPIYFCLWFVQRLADRKKFLPAFSEARSAILKTLLFGVMVLFLINAAYLFKGSFMPGNQYQWQSRSFQKKFQHSFVPIPFPKTFATGLDYTSYIQEHPEVGRGSNYILGKLHRKGRWFSFPIMILLKTPLAFFVFLAFSSFHKRKGGWVEAAFLWIPFWIWLLVFSLACHAQLGIRYVMPGLVFLFVVAGGFFESAPKKKSLLGFAALLLSWYALSTLSYHPHEISYFNEAIGERVNAYKYLADSNLDWEDKNYFILKFQEQNPSLSFELDPKTPHAGYLLVGANEFVGVMDENRYKWLRDHFKPIRHVTYSHYLFYVPAEQLAGALTSDNHE